MFVRVDAENVFERVLYSTAQPSARTLGISTSFWVVGREGRLRSNPSPSATLSTIPASCCAMHVSPLLSTDFGHSLCVENKDFSRREDLMCDRCGERATPNTDSRM